MTKRNWIYVALLVFIFLGSVIDAAWNDNDVAGLNGLVQGFGVVALVYWWEIVDAKELHQRRSTAARALTLLLPLLGHAIYLYQSRDWKPATALLLRFWAGVFIAAYLVGFLYRIAESLPY